MEVQHTFKLTLTTEGGTVLVDHRIVVVDDYPNDDQDFDAFLSDYDYDDVVLSLDELNRDQGSGHIVESVLDNLKSEIRKRKRREGGTS